MEAVVNALLPIFIVTGIGFVVRKGGWLSDSAFRGLGWLVFWVGLPAFLFQRIATMPELASEAWPIFYVMLGVTVCTIALGYLAAYLMRLNRGQTGAFVQAAFRGNLAFVGWPVLLATLDAIDPDRTEPAFQIAILAVAPLIAIYNVFSVAVLLPSVASADSRTKMIFKSIRSILTNPLIIACLGGIAWQWSEWQFPVFVETSLKSAAAMALPLALIALGGSLGAAKIRGTIKISFVASLLRIALGPTLAYVICHIADLPDESTVIAVIYMACPTAVASHVIAEQMGGDTRVSSNAVVLSTLLSMITIAIVMLLLVP